MFTAEATALIDRCRLAPRDPLRMELAKEVAQYPAGMGTFPGFYERAFAIVQTMMAISIATAMLVVDVIRWGGNAPTRWNRTTGNYGAIHGEWENRTRHCLPLVPQDGSVPILILGRPRQSLDSIAELFRRHVPGFSADLVRPLSVLAGVCAIPLMIGDAARYIPAAARLGVSIPLRARIAIAYRLFLGRAMGVWWRMAAPRPGTCVFAHTGTADSTGLELAMQATGTNTIHFAHGVSGGHNFDAVSDLYLAKCRHDAEWHEAMGSYRATLCPVAPKPAPTMPSRDGLLLLSNCAHPMNTCYLERGIAAEIEAIRKASGLARPKMAKIYRPHPAIGLLPERDRAAAHNAATDAGFAPWPPDMPYEVAAEFGLIATTPSTTVLDLLLLGRACQLIPVPQADPDAIYGRPEMRGAKGALDDYEVLFDIVGPARRLGGWQDILNLYPTLPANTGLLAQVIESQSAGAGRPAP